MDNYSPLNALMDDHMLDLQSQFARAHRNTKTEDCRKLAKEIALISIAQSLINISGSLKPKWALTEVVPENLELNSKGI